MSNSNESSFSSTDGQGKSYSPISSYKFLNESRDVNLNSKIFADSKLTKTDEEKELSGNGEYGNKEHFENSKMEHPSKNKNKENGSNANQDKVEEFESSLRNKVELASSLTSTNLVFDPESSTSHTFHNTYKIAKLDDQESENIDQGVLIPKSILNKNSSLTHEEIGKKFQDLSFAFKTDSMSIQKRLSLLKRRVDQAELNIENDVKFIKSKLESLKYFGINSEYIELLTDLKKQLGFVLNATIQLSSSAEAYGYAQHEEKSLEFVMIMVQHVENLESLKLEASKMLDKFKMEGKSPQSSMSLDNVGIDDRIFRRRSAATLSLENSSRRRASIATLPRLSPLVLDSVCNEKGSQSLSFSRPSGIATKKSPLSSRNQSVSLSETEESTLDSTGVRHRSDSRTNEISMHNIEELSEQRSPFPDTVTLEKDIDRDNDEFSHSGLKLLYQSIEEVRRNSNSQESLNVIYCLRKIIDWNKLLLSVARLRWPEHVLQYVPFYITWYVIFILVLVFLGGFFVGINGCCTYLHLQYLALWFLLLTLFLLPRRFYQFLISIGVALCCFLIFLFFFMTHVVFPGLSDQEINKLFRTYGLVLKVRYPNGPSPV